MITKQSLYTIIGAVLLGSVLLANDPTLLPEQAYKDLLLEAYTLGDTIQLLQIEVLNQFKESPEAGSSKSSCFYHTLRNGQLLAQSSFFPEDTKKCFEALIDPEHMASKLKGTSSEEDSESSEESQSPRSGEETGSPQSPKKQWRETVADKLYNNRKRSNPDFNGPINTDSPDTVIAQGLLDAISAEGILGDHIIKDAPLYYTVFENEFGTEITSEDFEEIVALENTRKIKEKIDAGEKVVGIISLHSKSMDLSDLSPRTSPDCSDDELYTGSIENNGHYISLCVIFDGKTTQVFLGDSAGRRNHFKENPVVRDLVQYLESPDLSNPISLDDMTQIYSFNEDSHIYEGWFSSLFGSPRKNRSNNIERSTEKNYALYAAAVFCTYAAYSYYLKASSENLLTHSVSVS